LLKNNNEIKIFFLSGHSNFSTKLFAQNTLSFRLLSGTNTDFRLNVSLQNQDNIAALQFDVIIARFCATQRA
jgi:hypothetical protein